jgi:hypothetical protein
MVAWKYFARDFGSMAEENSTAFFAAKPCIYNHIYISNLLVSYSEATSAIKAAQDALDAVSALGLQGATRFRITIPNLTSSQVSKITIQTSD